MRTDFPLAPMTTDLRVLTWVALVLPIALVFATIAAPATTRPTLLAISALVALTYASVWFVWRPTRFEIDPDVLRIVWPTRSRTIPRGTIAGVRVVPGGDVLRAEYGAGVRIGAGGLWGGFGLLKTRTKTFSMWISRTDRLVVVELRDARPLLVTPDDPERFVAALRA
jgi:hypothetical protein